MNRAQSDALPRTLADLAQWAADRYGDTPFLQGWSMRDGVGDSMSFREFARLERTARSALASNGVRRGSRVAFTTHASPEALALSLATTSLGGVVVNLNWRLPEETLSQLIDGFPCELFVASTSFTATARRVRDAAKRPPCRLLLVGPRSGPLVPGETRWDADVTAEDRVAFDGSESAEDDVALLMFTSGTSALPKAVPLTHGGLLWSCATKAAAEESLLGFSARGAPLSPRPPPHTHCPIGWLLWLISRARGEGADHRGTLAFLPTFHVIGYTNNFLYNLTVGARCFLREVWPLPLVAPAANLQAGRCTPPASSGRVDGPPHGRDPAPRVRRAEACDPRHGTHPARTGA